MKPEKIYICRTHEAAKELLSSLEIQGYLWRNGHSISKEGTNFNYYLNNTCYFLYPNKIITYYHTGVLTNAKYNNVQIETYYPKNSIRAYLSERKWLC